jgi:hypothetical protein
MHASQRSHYPVFAIERWNRAACPRIVYNARDVYFNDLAKRLGAAVGASGEIEVDLDMSTSVKRLYAADCVTPANCQMIIAACREPRRLKRSIATHSKSD